MKKTLKILSIVTLAAMAIPYATGAAAPEIADTASEALTAMSDTVVYPTYTRHDFTAVSVENDAVYCTDENGNEAVVNTGSAVIYTANALTAAAEDISEGDSITIYVLSDKPMTLQLPETYDADVIIIGEGYFTDADTYTQSNDMLVNSAGTLALNVFDDTRIVDINGNDAQIGEKLLVFYGASTKSIPAQTTPELIVSLDGYDNAEEQDFTGVSAAVIGDIRIEFDAVSINGCAMLPVRSISEALGYTVEWEPDDTVRLGNAFTMTVGKDSYVHAKMMAQTLGQAPVIINFGDDSLCYVPAEFYTQIMGESVYVENGEAIFESEI